MMMIDKQRMKRKMFDDSSTKQGTGNNGEECAVITKVGTKWEW